MRPSTPADAREAILDQLAYLLLEVEALEPIIGRIPETLRSGRPLEGDLSILELYGLIAAADEQVRLPRFRQIAAEDDPVLYGRNQYELLAGEAWNERTLPAVLARVRTAREALLDFLRALPPEDWQRGGVLGGARVTVYDLAFRITQEDLDLLRALGQRLHESHMTSRVQDLPK